MPEPPPPPVDLAHPFTRQAGLHAGLTDRQLQSERFRRLFQGVYVAAGLCLTPALWVEAARLVGPPDAFAAAHTAARLLGGIVPDTSAVHLGTASGRRSRVRGIHLHRYAVSPPLVRAAGQPCTSAARTFLDLGGQLELVDLVVLGDALVRRGQVTAAELVAATAEPVRWARHAARAAAYVRGGVDSAPESQLRLLLVLAGLPEPEVALDVHDAAGRARRLDLAWRSVKVAAEYDGRHHLEREGQWQHDLLRREQLEARGWRFVVVTSPDLHRTPGATIERVATVLAQAGLVIPRLRPAWRVHYPERGSYLA